jgi:enterochelin esterase-like enzyme
MKLFLILLTLGSLLQAQDKVNKKHLEPFKWNNSLPAQYEKEGVVHSTYKSEINKTTVGFHILLPSAYKDEGPRRYPVVYLLHGGRPGSESKLLNMVPFIKEAHQTKIIPPTIYVFVNGGPVSHYDYPTPLKHLGPEVGTKGSSTFIKELIPHIDATYRTIAERKGRFIEGYSQGGRGTLRAAFRNPELFAAASAGSAGVATELKVQQSQGLENDAVHFTPGDDVYSLAKEYAETKMKNHPLALLLYTGDSKKDFNWEGNVAYSKYLGSLGIEHQHLLIPGCGHSTKQAYEISGPSLFKFLAPHLKAATPKPSKD